jgi:hypothetical protein
MGNCGIEKFLELNFPRFRDLPLAVATQGRESWGKYHYFVALIFNTIMNSGLFKRLLPHLVAIIVFLIVTVIFCKPALDGKVLDQHDIIGWKGMAQNSFEYKAKHGHFPLWNPNLFSGMPNYQVAMEGKTILPNFITIMSLGLPNPMNFFFLACICFYILCIALRLNPVLGILGSIGFAYSTYNTVIVGAGHESQMYAISFMPFVLAGMIFTFEKKYWLGIAITTVAAYLELIVNHLQINFYFIIVAAFVTLAYLVIWIRNKEWKHLLISAAILALAAVVGVASGAVTMFTSYEYAKATMRGGKDISIEGTKVEEAKTTGLDTSYAFRYSIGKPETVTMLMPEAFGGSSSKTLEENSHVVAKLVDKGVPESSAAQLAVQLPRYWGGIIEGTSGPFYMGAIICLLGIIGFVIVRHPLRWALAAICLLAVMMAWGKYLPGFNNFLFNHIPFFNKFRVPSMTMVIPGLVLPIAAVLGLQQFFYAEPNREVLKEDFKKILYATGTLFVILLLMYAMLPYSSADDQMISANISQQAKNDEIGRAVIAGMKADRQSMFGGQLLRAFFFAVLLLGLLYAYIKNWLKPLVAIILITLISSVELLVFDKNYFKDENFITPDDMTATNFLPSQIDQSILKDKDPDFRVFNASANLLFDSRTTYFHKSIGGYHPARLRLYQDIIDRYLSAQPNEQVLNMLNTKYIIFNNPQTNQPLLDTSTHPYGPCWLVKAVKFVEGPVEEIQAIGNTDLKDTAVVQKKFAAIITQPKADSASMIQLTRFDNDTMEYSAHCNGPQLAVFSEVYYPYGWNAYVDGKKVDYAKVDYVLRGLSIPSGQHAIKFIFEPASYKRGVTTAYIASFLIGILLLGGLFMAWKESRKKTVTPGA